MVGPSRHNAPRALVSAARTLPISVAKSVSNVAPRQVAFAKDVAGAVGSVSDHSVPLTHLVSISSSSSRRSISDLDTAGQYAPTGVAFSNAPRNVESGNRSSAIRQLGDHCTT